MIDSIQIRNFRCLEEVSLKDFCPVNIVTGSNASGKSALLEAIYLGANASAHAVQNIAFLRGLPITVGTPIFPFVIPGQPQASPSLFFDSLFRSVSTNGSVESAQKIEISFQETNRGRSTLEIFYQTEGTASAPVSRLSNPTSALPVILLRKHANDNEERVAITVNPFNQLQQSPAIPNPLGPPTFIFGTNTNYAEVDNVAWFSQLRARNESEKVVEFIRQEFPFVKDLEILAPSGQNGLFAIMQDNTRRLLSTVSSGIHKIVSIMLATAHTRAGVIIIDEIENGIFYKKYAAIWRALHRFAKETGNQIFVSSHSKECLQMLPDVIGDNEGDFCLIRTEMANNRSTVTRIPGTAMKAALAGRNEIRGLGNGH